MTDSRKKIAAALVNANARSEKEKEARSLAKKKQAIIRAEDVVFSAIGQWTEINVEKGSQIPIVRDGLQIGSLPEPSVFGCPVWRVVSASLIEHKTEIDRKIKALQAVVKASDQIIKALGGMNYSDRHSLNEQHHHNNLNALAGFSYSLEERIIREVGSVTSAVVAASFLASGAKQQSENLKQELEQRENKPGRPRNEAAHAVARELALLYAKITGKRPTYSAGADGLSGEYTPVLREVFDALGWEETDLRGPATSAIELITDNDLTYEETPLSGLLSTAPPN